jgi:hypothetical protein
MKRSTVVLWARGGPVRHVGGGLYASLTSSDFVSPRAVEVITLAEAQRRADVIGSTVRRLATLTALAELAIKVIPASTQLTTWDDE